MIDLKEARAGDLYVDEHGHLHRLFSYCVEPTVTVESVSSGRQTGGAVGSPLMSGFQPLELCPNEALFRLIEQLSAELKELQEEKDRHVNQYTALAQKYLALMEEKVA